MDSPRGRILLMRIGHEEGEKISPEMVTHFDRCLGCMACVTACPSRRAVRQADRAGAAADRALRGALVAGARVPQGDLRALHPPGAAARAGAGREAGPKLAPLVPIARLQVDARARAAGARRRYRPLPQGTATSKAPAKRGTVAFMQGCIQRVFFGDVNAATLRVLSAEGWEVHAPAFAALLRRAADARGRRGGGDRARRGDDRGLRGLRQDRHQRRRLRLGDEGLRAHPATPTARASSPPRSSTSTSCWRPRSRRPCASRSSCAPPTTTPATSRTPRASARSRASCCAASPGWSCSSRAEWELCCGSRRHLQPAPARGRRASSARARRRTCAPPAPRRSPPPTRAARCRSPGTSTSRSITR